MQHVADLLEPDACQLASVLDTAEHPDRLIGGGGRGLRAERLAAFLIYQQNVSESAADVNTEPVGHGFSLDDAGRVQRRHRGVIDPQHVLVNFLVVLT